ncbi:hypothetical protein KKF55_00945 [Patescibacteria group bacterium]|nr:hypothetical protein [Patescibacteria group bacterium]
MQTDRLFHGYFWLQDKETEQGEETVVVACDDHMELNLILRGETLVGADEAFNRLMAELRRPSLTMEEGDALRKVFNALRMCREASQFNGSFCDPHVVEVILTPTSYVPDEE